MIVNKFIFISITAVLFVAGASYARVYNPETGSFISEDPIWQTNLYAYVDNNPILYVDPFGLLEIEDPMSNKGKFIGVVEAKDTTWNIAKWFTGKGENYKLLNVPSGNPEKINPGDKIDITPLLNSFYIDTMKDQYGKGPGEMWNLSTRATITISRRLPALYVHDSSSMSSSMATMWNCWGFSESANRGSPQATLQSDGTKYDKYLSTLTPVDEKKASYMDVVRMAETGTNKGTHGMVVFNVTQMGKMQYLSKSGWGGVFELGDLNLFKNKYSGSDIKGVNPSDSGYYHKP